MDLKDTLLALKKGTRNWQELFANSQKLLSRVKKKDPALAKSERSRFRAFLEINGNERLLSAVDLPFFDQKALIDEIADEMAAKYGLDRRSCYILAWNFLGVCTDHFEKKEQQEKLEKLSEGIFERKIREPRRMELLEKSENPVDLFEVAEISLKTEDFFNPTKAEEYYLKAAEKGISDGLFSLGLYYELDEKDYGKAKNIYEKLLEYGNPKGYTGLAILAKDQAEGNPYYNLEESKKMAAEGAQKRCGTSLYVLSGFDMGTDRNKAMQMAQTASLLDANLHAQVNAAGQFIQSVLNNLNHVFPDYAQAGRESIPKNFEELLLYLYTSKYNMVENYARFLELLSQIVKAIQAYYEANGKPLSEKRILRGLGIDESLLNLLAAQYSVLDEKAAALQNHFLSALKAE